jgi:hypothetical protein
MREKGGYLESGRRWGCGLSRFTMELRRMGHPGFVGIFLPLVVRMKLSQRIGRQKDGCSRLRIEVILRGWGGP